MESPHELRVGKSLSKVERTFRSLKTVDLKIRPIYHYKEERVRAHVFLCMLAYHVEWHLRQDLAPLLYEDEDKDLAESERTSPVAKAVRSTSANCPYPNNCATTSAVRAAPPDSPASKTSRARAALERDNSSTRSSMVPRATMR